MCTPSSNTIESGKRIQVQVDQKKFRYAFLVSACRGGLLKMATHTSIATVAIQPQFFWCYFSCVCWIWLYPEEGGGGGGGYERAAHARAQVSVLEANERHTSPDGPGAGESFWWIIITFITAMQVFWSFKKGSNHFTFFSKEFNKRKLSPFGKWVNLFVPTIVGEEKKENKGFWKRVGSATDCILIKATPSKRKQ